MIILFEKFSYSLKYLKRVLPTDSEGRFKGLPGGFVGKNGVLDGVGYLYNGSAISEDNGETNPSNRIVFVLPKVFLDETGKKAFGQAIPGGSEDKVEENFEDFRLNVPEDRYPKDFLADLSMWVCSSISQYRLSNPDDKFVETPSAFNFRSNKLTPTLIDVKNAMKRFYEENQNLIVFTAKNKHCGNNRIDWRQTITHTQPFIQNGVPIYMDLENKKKVFDLDDRLLVLYFSAMNYIESFGFKMPRSEFYEPMRVNEFRRFLGYCGLMELRRIKHKYFADKFLKLYNIMKAFFEWGGIFSANNFESEYLLTSKYNNVFEAMIDKLVGDDGKSIDSLKHNKDGKIIDHLYKEPSLIFASDDAEKIWHIGDSKYYQDPDDIKGESIAKQFTYAKNVIQDFFSPNYVNQEIGDDEKDKKLHDEDIHSGVRYRDPLTEGYSVTPNFFIRGFLPKFDEGAKGDSQYKDVYFRPTSQEKRNENGKDDERELFYLPKHEYVNEENGKTNISNYLWKKRNRHFKNRLFDRDTLLLQVYNVNFLYVLKAYTSKRSNLRNEFKKTARDMFRTNFLELLDKKYVFYAMWPKKSEVKFVNAHFRTLVGKIFKPAGFGCIILALEKEPPQTDKEKEDLEKMWKEVENDCSMILRVSPKSIWSNGHKLPETKFSSAYYDAKKNGFFVKREEFELAKIDDEHSIPSLLNGKPLTGACFSDVDLERVKNNKSALDEYYFLPCK